MQSVSEVSKLSGVSVRTLQYYDRIGLLPPTKRTAAGYRFYDRAALERLQQILLFRELEFSLSEIKAILDAPVFDRQKALAQQVTLLQMKKERLERIIEFAKEMQEKGDHSMQFEAFDRETMTVYEQRAKAQWGTTKEYQTYEAKAAARTAEETAQIAAGFMEHFAAFGRLRNEDVRSPAVMAQVKALQDDISERFYPCSNDILLGLGQMYVSDASFRRNIDAKGGEGTAIFVRSAILEFCKQ